MARMDFETGVKRFFTFLGGLTAAFVFLASLSSSLTDRRLELIEWLLLLLIMGGCVLAGWLLGISAAWVIRGFRANE